MGYRLIASPEPLFFFSNAHAICNILPILTKLQNLEEKCARLSFKSCILVKIGKIYNIGGGKEIKVNKIAKLIGGKKIYIPKRPGEPNCTWADISKAKQLLDWHPKVSFEDGVEILINNIDYWEDAPIWDKHSIAKATEKWFEYLS